MVSGEQRDSRFFGQDFSSKSFDSVKISIASPEQIRSWSFGEVKKPETINYRTFKPERDGLFCSRIFGPVKDYECLCGKYKRMKYKGVICEKCGVEVTLAKVRRDRMGHIELASPVAHIWFSKSPPSRMGIILDMSVKNIDRLLYFDGYVVLDPGLTGLEENQILTEDEYYRAQQEYGQESFRASTGAEAVKEMLANLDLPSLRESLRQELSSSLPEMRKKKVMKRLKLIEAFISSGARPEWMVLDVLPVMPPDLRPLVPLDGGRFATSDLNDLYRRIINRNNRLRRLIELRAPDMIIKNEKRMLQEIVDAFFDNGRRGRPIVGSNKRPLKSMSDILKGKHGRFRMNLLGKRVDYSARSVITVGPNLKLHQCGLPKKIALELFKPFIYSKLESHGFAPTIKVARAMVERERPEVWDILEEVVKDRLVLLNRAPTLHRLGIQAFEPILVEGKAIQLHPLVCLAFNADFDGDQMAVHVPLSLEAQAEARVLMLSSNNILSPANGSPITLPTKDIVLGIYYLSIMREGEKGEGRAFSGLSEMIMAHQEKTLSMHSKVVTRIDTYNDDGTVSGLQRVETTLGRMIVWDIIPKSNKIKFEKVNKLLSSEDILELLGCVYSNCKKGDTVEFLDRLVQLGFRYATLSGVSIGQDDMIVPKEKWNIVAETRKIVDEFQNQYLDGLITQGERYNKVTDAWTNCADRVAKEMMDEISSDIPGKPLNSVFIMANSGARGSPAQMKQLSAMRGLIARHDGSILEHPIVSNLKEGLRAFEYFNGTHGARKGMSDTALKTAGAGYLTRRLVDVAQDCVITELDCGTDNGVTIRPIVDSGEVVAPMADRVLGRICAEDVVSPETGELIIARSSMIDIAAVEKLSLAGIESVKCRSVITCESAEGICSMCYGKDLARNKLVVVGESVGVIAAQSIGEPGTQLTLRTFHSGGAAQRAAESSFVDALVDGVVKFRNRQVIKNGSGQTVVMNRHMEIIVCDSYGHESAVYRLVCGAHVFVSEGESVKAGQRLAEWDPYTIPVIAECDGYVHYVDLVDGVSMKEIIDESSGIAKRTVSDWQKTGRGKGMQPRVVIRGKDGEQLKLSNGADARYTLVPETVLMVDNGAWVHAGSVIARLSKETYKSRDIVGGLPRIAELFEARWPKDPAIMSECDGYVEYGKDYKSRRRVVIVPSVEGEKPFEFFAAKGRMALVQDGDDVKRGDILVDGNPALQDILRIQGVESLSLHLIKEIQNVYRLQGVKINDKHIEVIIRQMLRKVEITDPGDSELLVGDQIARDELKEINKRVESGGGRPASFMPVLQGITKASLHTRSFISAASFQETTRVLIEAAVHGKQDKLIGLKENVIAGKLIPAGTGFVMREMKRKAVSRDVVVRAASSSTESGVEKDCEDASVREAY
ncbi:DNA-directed RNA polymerase subunit beta' [Candidatus Hydrogenosomobacter endosymbioticus]|uniref:DNA-directed RNA polymerase subunit beta' n=1 Tax=Candidatus Hydrogenosomobacter endosymbioticus TaxID=2558174 RepID=A0ABM7V9U1_9PROT|nr:DNA-directed RNA polymerase subunit beta' [Candidatus Hydrogenosomobacter endosymbioticus]BDB96551.1 DNA-directed RNA polymerase subunit beta' [Candidatus Hydrogenosomobacter endosymbioticus]